MNIPVQTLRSLRGVFCIRNWQNNQIQQRKGARIGFALISNHAFVDGNKRIGYEELLQWVMDHRT